MLGWEEWVDTFCGPKKEIDFSDKKHEEQTKLMQKEIDSLRKTLEEKNLALACIAGRKYRFLNSKAQYSEILKIWNNELDYIFNLAREHSKE